MSCLGSSLWLIGPILDTMSLFALIVAVYQVVVTRLESYPAGELARRELNRQLKEEEENKISKVEAYMEGSNHFIYIENIGQISVKNVHVDVNGDEHVVLSLAQGFDRPELATGERFKVGGILFGMGSSGNVKVVLNWEELDGTPKKLEKVLSP